MDSFSFQKLIRSFLIPTEKESGNFFFLFLKKKINFRNYSLITLSKIRVIECVIVIRVVILKSNLSFIHFSDISAAIATMVFI